MGRDGVLKELPTGAALLSAGVQYCPDTRIPLPAHLGAAALCNFPVDDQLPYALLAAIIGRWYGRIKQKSKDSIAMFVKPFGKCKRLGRQIILLGQYQNSFSDSLHQSAKSILGNLVALMPEMKQSLKLDQQGLSKAVVGFIGQRCQELDIANQMRQAELLKPVGIFDIRAEKVADNCTAVCRTQYFFENFRRTRLGNAKEADYGRTKDPCPMLDTFIFPASLVDIQNRLGGNMFPQFFIRCGQRLIETIDNIAQMAASNVHIQNFAEKGLHAAIRGMERAFHISYQCLQTRAEKLPFNNTSRQFSPDNSTAFGTDKTIHAVFGDDKRLVIKFYRLLNVWFFDMLAAAMIAAIATVCIQRDRMVNVLRSKRQSIDPLMSGLAPLPTRGIGLFDLGRFDDIGGWRLGRVGGILREAGDLVGELGYLHNKLSVDVKKFGNLFFKFGDTLNIELFCFGSQFASLSHLLCLLSGERGPPLERKSYLVD